MSNLPLGHLWYFYVVAQERGFTRAQRTLHVGQPSISRAVKALEDRLGVKLLERHRRGVQLTNVGEEVFERCERIFRDVEDIQALASGEQAEVSGDLTIAASEHIATYLLPSILRELRKEMPKVVPRIYTGPTHLLLPSIAEGKTELGLFFKIGRDRQILRQTLRTVPCKLVVAPAFRKRRDVLESFIGSREVDDLANRKFPTVTYLRKKRPKTSIRMSSNSLETHKALVLSGCGISILPLFTVEKELSEGSLQVIHPEYTYDAKLQLATRRDRELSVPAQRVLAALRAQEATPRATPAR